MTRPRLSMVAIWFLASAALAGPAWCAVVEHHLTVHDPQRPGQEIPAVGYHDNQVSSPMDLVVFGHATATPVAQYAALSRSLAAAGYLVLLPATEEHFTGDQDVLADDMVALARSVLDGSAAIPADWPEPSGRWALAGHSLGGGAAVLAAARSAPDALVLLAPQERTRPSMIAQAGHVQAPTLILSGTLDCITPPGSHHAPLHQALSAFPRALVSLVGGGHCGFAAPCEPCSGAEEACPPDLDAGTMQALALELAGPWLRWQVSGVEAARDEFLATLDQPLINADLQEAVVAAPHPVGWRLRPLSASPAGARCRWRLEGPAVGAGVDAAVHDLRGRLVTVLTPQPASQGVELSWDGRDGRGGKAPAGVYLLRVTAGHRILSSRAVLLR